MDTELRGIAALTTATFDATTVDPTPVRFGKCPLAALPRIDPSGQKSAPAHSQSENAC